MAALNEDGEISNTSILFNPKGERTATYRKTHLFSLIGEEKHMAAGKTLGLAETPWGLTGLAVCYDIRFPELFRTYALKGVRIVVLSDGLSLPETRTLENSRAGPSH